MLDSELNEFGACVEIQFAQNVFAVCLHGVLADEQLLWPD